MPAKTTVIIPTLNEERYIATALNAIASGSVLPDELIVVDGGSNDQTVQIASGYTSLLIHNPKVHAAAARNLGIQHAQGDIVAFTDADCIPAPNWLERICQQFEQDVEMAGIGGRLVPHPDANQIESFSANVFINEVMRFSLKPQTHHYPGLWNGLITANCAYRKTSLLSVGGFRDVFANYGEDLDLMWRMIRDHKLVYDPDLMVTHRFTSTMKGLSKKYIQYGISSSLLTRYFLKSPRVDWVIYKRLFQNLAGALSTSEQRRMLARLYLVQLSSHLLGKYIGSYRYGVVNL